MRMSSFLLGGMVGAAAVIYFSRNNRPIMFSSLNQAMNKAGRFMSEQNGTDQHKTADSQSAKADESQVKNIIQSDPAIKQTVDDILSENQATTSYQ